MIKYLENRIWSLNAKILKTDANPDEVNKQLNDSVKSGLFANNGIQFTYTQNPIGELLIRKLGNFAGTNRIGP